MTIQVTLNDARNSNSPGARLVHLIITMMKWIRTSSLSVKNSLSTAVQVTLYDARRSLVRGEKGTCVASFWSTPTLKPQTPNPKPQTSFSSSLLLSSLELSDTQVYEPQMRALLGTDSHLAVGSTDFFHSSLHRGMSPITTRSRRTGNASSQKLIYR